MEGRCCVELCAVVERVMDEGKVLRCVVQH